MSDHKNYTLQEVLGWSRQDGIQTPFLSFHETASTPSDILIAAFIAQCILSNTPLCLVGVRYGFSHFQSLCRRLGVSTDDAVRKGLLYFIDCTQASLPSTSDVRGDDHMEADGTPTLPSLSLTEYTGIYYRVLRALLMVRKKGDDVFMSKFSICIDDLTTLSHLAFEEIPSSLSFLQQLLQLRGAAGTLCVSVTTPLPLNPSYPSSTSQILSTPGLLIPEGNPDSLFDLPIHSHGLSSAVAHFATNYSIYHPPTTASSTDDRPVDSLASAPQSPHIPSVCIEVSPLSSGYSKDIYAQLSIFRTPTIVTPSRPAGVGNPSSLVNGHISVVYLQVDNNGQLACHARA